MIDHSSGPFVLTFHDINKGMLASVGGKGANLGELARAGLPVPAGFCLTTAAYERVVGEAGLESILEELASTPATALARLQGCAEAIRSKILDIAMPGDIAEAITVAYHKLAPGEPIPVAVRSSATAEDLPFASFAGQQDTYLNIVGVEAVLDAVRRCWASLWTDRAVSYRASNGIDQRSVRLAVVIQRMVEAEIAGVLFTANPLTGRRRQAVIDASPGLGEAVVSGAVNPDHFVVNVNDGTIVERHVGDKRVAIRATSGGGTQRVELAEQTDEACILDEQVLALARLGARVEAHYGSPQDTEWAIDSSGQLWLTQARPITTLFPLPANTPISDENLRVYFSISVLQGVYRPMTPMGIQAFRLIGSAAARFATGKLPKNPAIGLPFLIDAGQRLFLDITSALRSVLGREVIAQVMPGMEAQSGVIFQQLIADPRLALTTISKWATLRKLIPLAIRTKIPLLMARALFRPQPARERITSLVEELRQQQLVVPGASSSERLDTFEHALLVNIPRVARTLLPTAFVGIVSAVLASRLLKGIATYDEVQTVLRSLPYNPTTEMDLSLWRLAERIRTDSAVADMVEKTPTEQLVQAYHEEKLPSLLQQGLADFLRVYGHRAVAEIDLGLPRWSEDPAHILGVLANYLQLKNPELAPDAQFERGAQTAEFMIRELTRRARRKGWFYGKLVRFDLRRIREMTGIREYPKYMFILLFARCRELLLTVGEELAEAGQLEKTEDIFFLTLPEAREAVNGKDVRALVRERRASYDYELKRRHIPRVLLSDGTEPTAEIVGEEMSDGALRGTPASAGRVTAKARVVLDPAGARLEPGEILVAPSTDPGWTPLFLTAGGLVMEMGGSMSHGSVVAREYGIPAVVGVHGATERITTGQRITVDGSNGMVVIEP